MIKFSRNNLKYQNANGNFVHVYMYVYRYYATGYYCIRTCHSKLFLVGLMVLSDGLVYFLKIEKNLLNQPKLSCGFNPFETSPGYTQLRSM